MKEFPEIFSILDTETTGMRPPYSRVIDIGIIRVEHGKVVERFQTLINPGVSIPSYIRRFTNISDEDLMDAPSFEDIALQIQELLSGAVFVAHNAPFDYGFVKSEFARINMPFSAETLCSVRFSRALLPKARSHSLDAIISRYGLSVSERHRALPDAEAVWDFFTRVNGEHDPQDIRRALEAARSGSRGKHAPGLVKETFTDLPDSAGVYFFYGPEQELLYVGKSKHVRTRARSHFNQSAQNKKRHLQEGTSSVQSIRTSGELSALILEAALIKSESPIYNRALRKRKTLVIAQAQTADDGYITILLTRASGMPDAANALGIFRTTTQAKLTLRELAKEYRLCPKLMGLEAGGGACFAYQLGQCNGACIGKEDSATYNERLQEAFSKRRFKTWPYKGTVMIDEKEDAESGTVFFIDNWIVLGAFRYSGDEYEPLSESVGVDASFDYDTYKILVRFMLNPKNRRAVRVLTKNEYTAAYARCTGSYETDVSYEETF
ncbi:MAG: hypothetical protein JWN49_122 [Parcubacteria group bacterium]|nr:hypothetical protein [Parcubacteria group bacterium]